MDFLKILTDYLQTLNWVYIVTLVFIVYFVDKFSRHVKYIKEIPRVWKVFIFGLLYGAILAYFLEYNAHEINILFISLLFAMVFHDLLRVKKIIKIVSNKLENVER